MILGMAPVFLLRRRTVFVYKSTKFMFDVRLQKRRNCRISHKLNMLDPPVFFFKIIKLNSICSKKINLDVTFITLTEDVKPCSTYRSTTKKFLNFILFFFFFMPSCMFSLYSSSFFIIYNQIIMLQYAALGLCYKLFCYVTKVA